MSTKRLIRFAVHFALSMRIGPTYSFIRIKNMASPDDGSVVRS
jgi:hypothetical protein